MRTDDDESVGLDASSGKSRPRWCRVTCPLPGCEHRQYEALLDDQEHDRHFSGCFRQCGGRGHSRIACQLGGNPQHQRRISHRPTERPRTSRLPASLRTWPGRRDAREGGLSRLSPQQRPARRILYLMLMPACSVLLARGQQASVVARRQTSFEDQPPLKKGRVPHGSFTEQPAPRLSPHGFALEAHTGVVLATTASRE
jgi:hypothetical protein